MYITVYQTSCKISIQTEKTFRNDTDFKRHRVKRIPIYVVLNDRHATNDHQIGFKTEIIEKVYHSLSNFRQNINRNKRNV